MKDKIVENLLMLLTLYFRSDKQEAEARELIEHHFQQYKRKVREETIEDVIETIDEIKLREFQGITSPIAAIAKLRNRILSKLQALKDKV